MSEYHREERIYSHPKPFNGQRHRSSGNFSTRYIQDPNGKKPKSLLWEIIAEKPDEKNKISFKVYGDVANGVDDKKLKGIRIVNGQRTMYIDERSLYIHSPEGATAPFTVVITGMDT
ncbi:MAG: hypothetical protein NC251_00510 [Lachnoclostridium sp.]|nr:hypothetical protein [Lachnospira sp.]MCM1246899.1 hypothetical protein [Lachnoclostridium sp.]